MLGLGNELAADSGLSKNFFGIIQEPNLGPVCEQEA